MDFSKILNKENLNSIGIVGTLCLVVGGWLSGALVAGTSYNEMKAERDKWMAVALDGLNKFKDVNPVPNIAMSGPGPMSSPIVERLMVTPEDVSNKFAEVKEMAEISK